MSDRKSATRWLVVLGSTISLIVSNGPVLFFKFAVFLKPISEQLGWSRGTMSLAVTLGLVLGGIATPIAGILIDRWGIQKVTLGFITIFAASFSAISLTGTSPLSFIFLYAIAGFFAGGQAPLPYAKAISGWFEERRGLALGIAMAGVGIGLAVVPQVVRALLNSFDWRETYLIVGGLTWLIAFPAVLFFVKDPPNSRDGGAALTGVRAEGDDMSAAARRKDFWLTLIASFLVVTAINGVIAHLVALLTDHGLPNVISVKMLVAVGLSAIAGRLISGFLLDRFFAPYLAAIIFVVPLIGLALLLIGVQSVPLVLVASICLGFGLGAEVDIIGFLVGRYFGLRRYGEIYGYIFAVFTIGSGIGPYLMGATFDATGNYKLALAVFCGLMVVSSALIAMLGPYRYPEKRVANVP
jgi:predicted MFS family arabinose efflux permease